MSLIPNLKTQKSTDKWVMSKLGDHVATKSKGIVPNKTPNVAFELYSVPSHEFGRPEIVMGKEIGSNKQIVEDGTVLLCKINPRINRTWVVASHSQNQKIASTEWITFPPSDVFIPKYLAYFLQQDSVRDFLAANASGVGGSLMRVKPATVSDYLFPVAPKQQQQRIVAEIEKQFSRLDEAVASLKRIQVNLKRYKAAVLKAAVEGKLTEQWRKDHPDVKPANQLLKRILAERRAKWEAEELAKMKAKGIKPKDDSWKKKYKEPAGPDTANLPELPEGWVWATLESVSEALGGYAFESKNFSNSGYQVVKMANIKMGRINLSQNPSFISDVGEGIIQKYLLAEGDILVTLTGTRKKRDYGYVAVVGLNHNLLLNQRIARIRPSRNIIPKYLALAMQSEIYQNSFFSYETGNVGQGNVGMGAVTKEAIALPSRKEQEAILEEHDRRLSVTDELEATIETNLKRAERLRQTILSCAFFDR